MRKFTAEEVSKRLETYGFKLIGDYKNTHTKTLIMCHCGKLFYPKINHIFTKSTKSCGRCNEPKIGDKFNSLTITKVRHSRGRGCMVQSVCDCGNNVDWRVFHKIMTGHTSSCGHCKDLKIGDIFGNLTVIEVIPSIHNGCSVKCLCSCGVIKQYRSNVLRHSTVLSCGNCKQTRNGVWTSSTALKLQNIIETILDTECVHNKKIGKYYIDIVQEDLKIAIEYDSYYYHRVHHNTIKKEREINKIIRQHGYKLLRIRSDGYDFPTEKQLRKILLNDFKHNCKKKTITMKSWKDKEKVYKHDISNCW